MVCYESYKEGSYYKKRIIRAYKNWKNDFRACQPSIFS